MTSQGLSLSPLQLAFTALALTTAFLLHRLLKRPSNLPPGPPTDFWGSNRSQLSREKPWLQLEAWGKKYGQGRGFYTIWTGPNPTIGESSFFGGSMEGS